VQLWQHILLTLLDQIKSKDHASTTIKICFSNIWFKGFNAFMLSSIGTGKSKTFSLPRGCVWCIYFFNSCGDDGAWSLLTDLTGEQCSQACYQVFFCFVLFFSAEKKRKKSTFWRILAWWFKKAKLLLYIFRGLIKEIPFNVFYSYYCKLARKCQ